MQRTLSAPSSIHSIRGEALIIRSQWTPVCPCCAIPRRSTYSDQSQSDMRKSRTYKVLLGFDLSPTVTFTPGPHQQTTLGIGIARVLTRTNKTTPPVISVRPIIRRLSHLVTLSTLSATTPSLLLREHLPIRPFRFNSGFQNDPNKRPAWAQYGTAAMLQT